MKRFVFPVLVFGAFLSSAAAAGPLEDGIAAYNKGAFAEALKLLTPLAEAGEGDAQYPLALMYSKGEGVTKDNVKAYVWYDQLAKKGDKDAEADRDALAAKMTPEHVAEAKKISSEWRPK